MKKITARTLMNRYNKIKAYFGLSDLAVFISEIYEDYYINLYAFNYETSACKALSISLLIRVTPKRLKEIEEKLR